MSRRTEISGEAADIRDMAELITEASMVVTISRAGYISAPGRSPTEHSVGEARGSRVPEPMMRIRLSISSLQARMTGSWFSPR